MAKTVIEAKRDRLHLNLKELFQYKDLFRALASRDFKVRYAQTFLGFSWAVLQPIITLTIFIIVFGETIQVDTSGIPYPLFALAGICAWNYFSFVVSQGGSSLIGAQNLITKIYFPRLIIPLSKAVVGFVDFLIVFILLIILMLIYGYTPGYTIIYLPVFILITIVSALTAGIWLSALSIRYRDIQTITPFLVQFGLYTTPVAYSVSIIPENYKILFYLNPMTAVVQGFRWCLLGIDPPDLFSYFSFLIVLVLFVSGLYYFKKVERIMADII